MGDLEIGRTESLRVFCSRSGMATDEHSHELDVWVIDRVTGDAAQGAKFSAPEAVLAGRA